MSTPFDELGPVRVRKPRLFGFKVIEQLEDMKAAITADNETVVAAMTAASAEATLEAAQGALATAISDANTQAASRVADVVTEIDKLKDILAK